MRSKYVSLDELQELGDLGWTTEVMSREEINQTLTMLPKLIAVARAAKAGLSTMRCDWFGHQDNVCPRCILEGEIEDLEDVDEE